MSLLDDEKVLLDDKTVEIKAEMENLLATALFRRGGVSAFVTEHDSLAGTIKRLIKNAIGPRLKEHQSREIHPIDCRTLRKGDAYGWLSAVSKASKDPILVIEHLTEIPDGDRSIYDDPAYVTNLLLRSWKNEDIYAGDLEIDRRQFTVILACRDIDAQEFERECALCSYGWCGDFDSYLEEQKNIATESVTDPKNR